MNISETKLGFGLLTSLMLIGLIACNEHPETNNPVRPIELAALDKMIADKTFSGLVVAMASWCPPCREELPILGELFDAYRGRGISIVAISLDADGPEAVQPLINQLKIPFPVYWVGTKAIQQYRIVGIPTLMVINKGRLVEKLPGSHSRGVIQSKLENLLQSTG